MKVLLFSMKLTKQCQLLITCNLNNKLNYQSPDYRQCVTIYKHTINAECALLQISWTWAFIHEQLSRAYFSVSQALFFNVTYVVQVASVARWKTFLSNLNYFYYGYWYFAWYMNGQGCQRTQTLSLMERSDEIPQWTTLEPRNPGSVSPALSAHGQPRYLPRLVRTHHLAPYTDKAWKELSPQHIDPKPQKMTSPDQKTQGRGESCLFTPGLYRGWRVTAELWGGMPIRESVTGPPVV